MLIGTTTITTIITTAISTTAICIAHVHTTTPHTLHTIIPQCKLPKRWQCIVITTVVITTTTKYMCIQPRSPCHDGSGECVHVRDGALGKYERCKEGVVINHHRATTGKALEHLNAGCAGCGDIDPFLWFSVGVVIEGNDWCTADGSITTCDRLSPRSPRHAQDYGWVCTAIVEYAPVGCVVSQQCLFYNQLLVDWVAMQ